MSLCPMEMPATLGGSVCTGHRRNGSEGQGVMISSQGETWRKWQRQGPEGGQDLPRREVPTRWSHLLLGDEPLQNTMAEHRGLTAYHTSAAWLWLFPRTPPHPPHTPRLAWALRQLHSAVGGLGQLGG